MAYYIVDEVKKSIHNSEKIDPNLCKVSTIDKYKKTYVFNENDLRELLLYMDYNGCRYCLKKYYMERTHLRVNK